MKVTIIGTGYVGLVTGACLAEVGNEVFCVDVDARKIGILNAGGIPIFEPGLDDLVSRNRTKGRLSFTTDIPDIVRESTVVFIAVGTPPRDDGGVHRFARGQAGLERARRREPHEGADTKILGRAHW